MFDVSSYFLLLSVAARCVVIVMCLIGTPMKTCAAVWSFSDENRLLRFLGLFKIFWPASGLAWAGGSAHVSNDGPGRGGR